MLIALYQMWDKSFIIIKLENLLSTRARIQTQWLDGYISRNRLLFFGDVIRWPFISTSFRDYEEL